MVWLVTDALQDPPLRQIGIAKHAQRLVRVAGEDDLIETLGSAPVA
jgi:hypothetical protein